MSFLRYVNYYALHISRFKPLEMLSCECFVFPIFPSAFDKFFYRVVFMYLFYCLVLLVYFVKVVFWFLWIYFFFTLKREKKAGPSLFNTFESVRVYIRACSNISTKFKCFSFTVGSVRVKGAIFDSFFWIFNTLIWREKFPFQCSLVALNMVGRRRWSPSEATKDLKDYWFHNQVISAIIKT